MQVSNELLFNKQVDKFLAINKLELDSKWINRHKGEDYYFILDDMAYEYNFSYGTDMTEKKPYIIYSNGERKEGGLFSSIEQSYYWLVKEMIYIVRKVI